VIVGVRCHVEQQTFSSCITMSKPLHGVTEGVTVTCPNITSPQRGRPKAAAVAASSGDRQTVPSEGSTDDMPTAGKRFSTYPIQRRGSRKKTLSLNPEEREALENLIEEVIMGGVGEGVIDSDASSSDEDDDVIDDQSPSSQNSLPTSSTAVAVGDASRHDTFVKGGKKFYPGQLKVALKHMHDLPPRFVRKLAKAQQYLDAGGIVSSKPVVSVGRIDEEEETTARSKDDSKRPKAVPVATTFATSVLEQDRDKTRLKENKLKDAKKMIRTLLTDRDQYVDEAVNSAIASNRSHQASSDDVFQAAVSTSSDQNPQSVSAYHQHDAAPRQLVSDNAVSGENTVSTYSGSFSSVATCTSSTHVYHSGMGGNVSNKVAEYVPKSSDSNYRTGQSSNLPVTGSCPIPAQPFASPSPGIPPYQLSVPVVHGMKPAPVLSQSPPGTQFWIPQAVVPSNAPGYYGSSPPVVGMTGVPSAFNQPVPYAYSIQSSYPTVQGVHVSYAPQYLYSASPPNQSLVGQPYSAATFSQPVSYPLTVLHPDHYVRPPSAMSANFYQNTPPPGYCPTQLRPAGEQRHMFARDVPPPVDGTRKVLSADHVHSLSALSAPVTASHMPSPQPANCSFDTRSGYMKPACTGSVGVSASDNRESCQKCPPLIRPSWQNSSVYHSSDTGAKMMTKVTSHAQQSSPHPAAALNSHRPRFSKSPVNMPLSSPCSAKTGNCSPHSVLKPGEAGGAQSPTAPATEVSELCALNLAVVEKTSPSATVEHSDVELSHEDAGQSNFQCSPANSLSPISNTGTLSKSSSSEPACGDHSYMGGCDTQASIAGCSDISEPCATTPAMPQESDTRNAVDEESASYTLNKSVVQPAVDSDMAKVPSVDETEPGIDVVSSDTKDVICSSYFIRTDDSSGESLTGIELVEVIGPASVEDHLASELQSGLNCTSEAETISTCSSYHESQLQQSSRNPVSSSEPQATVVDEVADISFDCIATGGSSSSSDLVVTLSSSLRSALVEMFGPPVECDTGCGM